MGYSIAAIVAVLGLILLVTDRARSSSGGDRAYYWFGGALILPLGVWLIIAAAVLALVAGDHRLLG